MAAKFRINRYNWFGQKLLVQHRYLDIINLRDSQASAGLTSDHLIYLNGLALMKTCSHLDEVINSLQQLNFEQNNQYFLLLCQCLLYLGNYDSVVALCKRIINKDDKSSQLINEPRLWYIFGLCLEYQYQYKDAQAAYRMSAKLTTDQAPFSSMGNHYVPHIKYAEFCIQHKSDLKSAHQVLTEASLVSAQSYKLNSMLALVMSTQTTAQKTNLCKAIEIISSLELHSVSSRNPSSGYNKLASKCKRRLKKEAALLDQDLKETGDEDQNDLGYLLAKSHITLNNLQISEHDLTLQNDKLIEVLKKSDSDCWLSSSLWNNLGLCYLAKKRFIACLSCLLKAYHLNPLDWRINFNLAVACIHVGLITRAFTCLHAASNFRANQLVCKFASLAVKKPIDESVFTPLNTLLAICYEKLGELDEARRLYIKNCRQSSILSLVNYLLFLHRNSGSDEHDVKVKLHLLDQIEQHWLQRNQNDPQFYPHLLDAARKVGETTFGSMTKKTYAWTKMTEIN